MKGTYMNKKVHITAVLDRSGSMGSIRDDIIGGFNLFLKDQQRDGENTTLTLVLFDTEDAYEVIHSFKAIKHVPPLNQKTYRPRSGTPLLDAMGRTITNLGNWLSSQSESDRPERIIVVFVTDGQENSSHEYNRAEVVRLMELRKKESNWQFVFLSADLDAINEAGDLGVAHASSMSYDRDTEGVMNAFRSVSESSRVFRMYQKNHISFSANDRAKQKSESQRS